MPSEEQFLSSLVVLFLVRSGNANNSSRVGWFSNSFLCCLLYIEQHAENNIYIYTHICVNIYTHTYICIHIHRHTYIYIYIYHFGHQYVLCIDRSVFCGGGCSFWGQISHVKSQPHVKSEPHEEALLTFVYVIISTRCIIHLNIMFVQQKIT